MIWKKIHYQLSDSKITSLSSQGTDTENKFKKKSVLSVFCVK